MATREVVIASTASNQAKKVQTSATTWGELKAQSEVASLISGDVEAIVNPGKITLGRDESVLPEGNFQLFLIPKKNKAGVSYDDIASQIGEAIRKAAAMADDDDVTSLRDELVEAVADHFNVDVEDLGLSFSTDSDLNEAMRIAREL